MDSNDYSIADTTRRYFYSLTKADTLNGIEISVGSKAELEKAIKAGKAYSHKGFNVFFFRCIFIHEPTLKAKNKKSKINWYNHEK